MSEDRTMVDNIYHLPSGQRPPLFCGPFSENRVVIEGRFVPGLTGWQEGDKTWLCVDRRFCQVFSSEEDAYNAAVLIAQASAVAHGYPHFAADSKQMPFVSIATAVGPEEIKP